jgi:hypothetical protein
VGDVHTGGPHRCKLMISKCYGHVVQAALLWGSVHKAAQCASKQAHPAPTRGTMSKSFASESCVVQWGWQ